jgi:hypothetical protein
VSIGGDGWVRGEEEKKRIGIAKMGMMTKGQGRSEVEEKRSNDGGSGRQEAEGKKE